MRATDDGDGRLRVAVVGAMGFGAFHLRALQDLTAAAVLTAVVDPRPAAGEVLEMLGRAPQYASLTDLLAEQRPDIVVIASPIPTHAPLAEEAMRAGCHLLLEKPPTASLAEYESLIAVAQETGRVVQVGFQADGSSAYDAISAAVAAGEIGEVRGVGAVGTWVRATSYFARAPWAGRRRLDSVDVVDGVVTNPLAHAVQAALRLAGARRAEDVAAVEAELFRANDIEADDTSSIRVITATGLPVAVGLTLCAAAHSEPRVIVHGSAGRIVYWYKTDRIEISTARGSRSLTATSTGALADLVAHLRGDTAEPASPLTHAGAFMRVMEAVRTAPEPATIPARLTTWHEDEVGRHVVVDDVEAWCERVAESLRTFTTLGAPWAPRHSTLATLRLSETTGAPEVARYVDGAGTSALDSPRPHLHPVRTTAGVLVSAVAPADHTWHAGVGMAVQDVGGHNLWGGRTYVRGSGYMWRDDHGRITHEQWRATPGQAHPTESGDEHGEHRDGGYMEAELAWRGHDGSVLLTEIRTLTWSPEERGWRLGWTSALTNATADTLALGSPGSNGRVGGGYGGFFWRLPACSDVDVRTAQARGEEAVHGTVAPWLAWSATTAEGDVTLVITSGDGDPWFVRVAGYPGFGSSLAWSEPVQLAPATSISRRFRIFIADGRLTDDEAAEVAARL